MIQLTDAAVVVNDEVVAIEPNTLTFREGFGEFNMRAAQVGAGKSEQVFSRNLESALGECKFELPTTPENVALVRSWLANGNVNVVQFAGSTPEGEVTRTFTQAAVVNNPEAAIGSEGSIPVEWMANPAI